MIFEIAFVKYFKEEGQKTFTLEVEQKVTILNIGVSGAVQGTNITYGLTNLKIQTNGALHRLFPIHSVRRMPHECPYKFALNRMK